MARIADVCMYGGAVMLVGFACSVDWRLGVAAVGGVLIGIGIIIAIGANPYAG